MLCGVLLVIRVRFSSAARSIGAVSDVNFVKAFAKAIERLRRGEIARLELVGFAQATPERRSLVQGLVEDHRHALGPDIVTRVLPSGDFEISRTATRGEAIEIDIGKPIPD